MSDFLQLLVAVICTISVLLVWWPLGLLYDYLKRHRR
jgi:hypothetical protein